jgi:hydrogenase-4 component H
VLLSKLREAIICLKAGRVTLPYPFAPHDPEPGFRGKIAVDFDKCIGCAGCVNVCTPAAITTYDKDQATRVMQLFWRRCTYCGRCQEVCPENAIKLSQEFETATNKGEDMTIRWEVFMGPCQRCGRCFPPPTVLERMMTTGFRKDTHGARS